MVYVCMGWSKKYIGWRGTLKKDTYAGTAMRFFTALLATLIVSSNAHALPNECKNVDYAKLSSHVANLTVYYPEPRGYLDFGFSSTVWFRDPKHIVATLHTVQNEGLFVDWYPIALGTAAGPGMPSETKLETKARLVRIVDTDSPEKLSILELEDAFPGAVAPKISHVPLRRDQAVVGVSYKGVRNTDRNTTDMVLQHVKGLHKIPEFSETAEPSDEPPPPFLLFEVMDPEEKDRYVIDHGGSGAPLFDCDGNAVAVAATFLTDMLTFMPFSDVRVTTPWGMHNIFGVSAAYIRK